MEAGFSFSLRINDTKSLSHRFSAFLTLSAFSFHSVLLFPPVRLFSSSSVEGIMKNLKTDGSEFAKKQAEVRRGQYRCLLFLSLTRDLS